MTIPNDNYTLNEKAIKFATIFRLAPDQFDSHNDTEALIHLGVFKDIRAYHALRSLAWSTFALAEKKDKKLDQFTFETLSEIGNAYLGEIHIRPNADCCSDTGTSQHLSNHRDCQQMCWGNMMPSSLIPI